jgi:SAM-dependent methyltransferase
MSAAIDSTPHLSGAGGTQYDEIAALYQRSKRSPVRRFIESFTFLGLLGDARDLRVLDLACGEGFYTRMLRKAGARRVLGVDISPAMIELARAEENASPIGVEYVVSDVQHMPVLGEFDIAVAGYLLHYASNHAALFRMCRAIAAQLPVGGRFITINENPDQTEDRYRGYEQYGFGKSVSRPRREGSAILYTMVAGREVFRFEVTHFDRTTYESALRSAGFSDIRWHAVQLDPAGAEAHGADYWAEYLGNPPIVGLECRRSA